LISAGWVCLELICNGFQGGNMAKSAAEFRYKQYFFHDLVSIKNICGTSFHDRNMMPQIQLDSDCLLVRQAVSY
jgi:hypothetical protein